MPIPAFNLPLTPGTAGQVLQTDGNSPENTSWVDKGGSGGLLTAVVDIGPTTNNGPGDQTKGILDWATAPIDIVLPPGANKPLYFNSMEVRYKFGTAAYTIASNDQKVGLLYQPDSDVLLSDTSVTGPIAALVVKGSSGFY